MAENSKTGPKVLFINTGASLTGAPLLFLNTLKWFKENSLIKPSLLLSGQGPLDNKFTELGPVFRWDGELAESDLNKFYWFRLFKRILKKLYKGRNRTYRSILLERLQKEKFDLIYANSVSSCSIIFELKKLLDVKVILHVRELEISINQFCGRELFIETIPLIDLLIADSEAVSSNLINKYGLNPQKITVIFEYIDLEKSKFVLDNIEKTRSEMKARSGLPDDSFVVISSGTTDWRKGADLLVHIARKVFSFTNVPIYFIWIGGEKSGLDFQKLQYDIEKLGFQKKVIFMGSKENPLEYFAMADLFLLCSREEPVGIVALEAASLKKPVLCFEEAGGMPEFVGQDCGFIIPYLDIDSMAEHIITLKNNQELARILGNGAYEKVQKQDMETACRNIEDLLYSIIPKP